MFRQVSTIALVVVVVLGSVAITAAEEPQPTTKQITNSIGTKFG